MKNNNQFSKECIATALIELMKTKDYSSITITEIAKKSGMSRMTYYRNYSSKDDILVQYINSVGEQIQDLVIKRNSPYDTETYFTILFESFGVNSDIGYAAYSARLGDLILDTINKNMMIAFPPSLSNDPDKVYKRFYFAGAFYNVFLEWVKRGKKETPEHMAKLLCSFMETPYSKM